MTLRPAGCPWRPCSRCNLHSMGANKTRTRAICCEDLHHRGRYNIIYSARLIDAGNSACQGCQIPASQKACVKNQSRQALNAVLLCCDNPFCKSCRQRSIPVSAIGVLEYENPTPTGCSRNTILAYRVQLKGLRIRVRFLSARHGPNSVYNPRRPEQPRQERNRYFQWSVSLPFYFTANKSYAVPGPPFVQNITLSFSGSRSDSKYM
jgi:hypothetical protein